MNNEIHPPLHEPRTTKLVAQISQLISLSKKF